MNNSAETPQVNNQTAAVPCKAASKDREKRSIADRAKGFFKDERAITAAAAVVVAGLIVALARGQYAHADTEDFEPVADPEAEDRQKRSPPVLHKVSGGQVRLSNGRQASERAKANSRRDTGKDPNPGYTYREDSFRGVPLSTPRSKP